MAPFSLETSRYLRSYERRNCHFHRVSRTATREFKAAEARARGRRTVMRRIYGVLLRLDARRASAASMARLMDREAELFRQEWPEVAEYYGEHFRRMEPDLIVSTTPHQSMEAPAILIARHMGIASVCWVTSWDNLTSKPAPFARYDGYLVWSDRMAAELERYYPESRGMPVEVTGPPQFDWYRQSESVVSRESFCASLMLDPGRPILFYGACTPSLFYTEHLLVDRLARAANARELPEEAQLIVRLHPGDGTGGRWWDVPRGVAVRFQTPGEAGRGELSSFIPTEEENREFVNALAHSAVVLNAASTISLDACALDRPVVNVGFDPSPDRLYQERLQHYYYTYDHYRTVTESGAVRIARTYDELIDEVAAYIDDPSQDRQERAKLLSLWCGEVDGRAAERVAEALRRFSTNRTHGSRSSPAMSDLGKASALPHG
jgi:hypothetical protein